jgi:hypothetical protein
LCIPGRREFVAGRGNRLRVCRGGDRDQECCDGTGRNPRRRPRRDPKSATRKAGADGMSCDRVRSCWCKRTFHHSSLAKNVTSSAVELLSRLDCRSENHLEAYKPGKLVMNVAPP